MQFRKCSKFFYTATIKLLSSLSVEFLVSWLECEHRWIHKRRAVVDFLWRYLNCLGIEGKTQTFSRGPDNTDLFEYCKARCHATKKRFPLLFGLWQLVRNQGPETSIFWCLKNFYPGSLNIAPQVKAWTGYEWGTIQPFPDVWTITGV